MTDPFQSPVHDLVGGAPEILGPWQLTLLRRHGLQPEHRLLDLGCSTLRGGLWLIRFLSSGNYVGVDPSLDLLSHGREQLAAAALRTREPVIGDLSLLDELAPSAFDYVFTQSVLNHLDEKRILQTVARVDRLMAQHGAWITTGRFDGAPGSVRPGTPHPKRQGEFLGTVVSLRWFEGVLAQRGLGPRLDPEAAHPRGLQTLLIRRSAAA